MEPVFDLTGAAVAWLRGPELIDLSGAHVGYLRGTWLASYRGAYVGRFLYGWLRDLDGAAVGFLRGATGLPSPPAPQEPPPPPVPGPAPRPRLLCVFPRPTVPKPVWREDGWPGFVAAAGLLSPLPARAR